MTCQSARSPISDDRRRRISFRRLANLLNLFLLFSLLSIQGAPQEPNGAGNEKDIRMLEPGQSIKRELAVGQEHAYQIRLSVDQFLKVAIEQQGIDVLAQVMAPDGKQITEFDSESSLWGKESASLVAKAPGDYRLIVHPTQKRASA